MAAVVQLDVSADVRCQRTHDTLERGSRLARIKSAVSARDLLCVGRPGVVLRRALGLLVKGAYKQLAPQSLEPLGERLANAMQIELEEALG